MQTTSVNPREEHREFWANNLTLPIDDPFWDKHRPGDQWNCKCWLEQTDTPRTALEDMPDSADIPEPKAGLRGNTAKTKEIFSQDHPHFPNKCASCRLNTDGKAHGVGRRKIKNADQKKGNCQKCVMSDNCKARLDKLIEKSKVKYVIEETYENGGQILISEYVCRKDSDFPKILQIAKHLASQGSMVEITPRMFRDKRFEYNLYYEDLLSYKGGKYKNKCPDLRINGIWYEHEGFVTTKPRNAIKNMLNHGTEQSDRIIMDKPNLDDWYIRYRIEYIRYRIEKKISEGKDIEEVWLREENRVYLFFKRNGN